MGLSEGILGLAMHDQILQSCYEGNLRLVLG